MDKSYARMPREVSVSKEIAPFSPTCKSTCVVRARVTDSRPKGRLGYSEKTVNCSKSSAAAGLNVLYHKEDYFKLTVL